MTKHPTEEIGDRYAALLRDVDTLATEMRRSVDTWDPARAYEAADMARDIARRLERLDRAAGVYNILSAL